MSRRTSHDLGLRSIYSSGKVLDVTSNSGSEGWLAGWGDPIVGPFGAGEVIRSGNRAAQRGSAHFDIRQQFCADGTWTVPNNYSTRLERSLLGGWQFGGVRIFQTGLPFTVYNGSAFSPLCSANPGGSCYDTNNAFIPGSVITGDSGGDYNADGSNYDLPNAPSFGSHLSGVAHKKFLKGVFPASAFPVPTPGSEGNLGRNTYDQPGYNNLNFELLEIL